MSEKNNKISKEESLYNEIIKREGIQNKDLGVYKKSIIRFIKKLQISKEEVFDKDSKIDLIKNIIINLSKYTTVDNFSIKKILFSLENIDFDSNKDEISIKKILNLNENSKKEEIDNLTNPLKIQLKKSQIVNIIEKSYKASGRLDVDVKLKNQLFLELKKKEAILDEEYGVLSDYGKYLTNKHYIQNIIDFYKNNGFNDYININDLKTELEEKRDENDKFREYTLKITNSHFRRLESYKNDEYLILEHLKQYMKINTNPKPGWVKEVIKDIRGLTNFHEDTIKRFDKYEETKKMEPIKYLENTKNKINIKDENGEDISPEELRKKIKQKLQKKIEQSKIEENKIKANSMKIKENTLDTTSFKDIIDSFNMCSEDDNFKLDNGKTVNLKNQLFEQFNKSRYDFKVIPEKDKITYDDIAKIIILKKLKRELPIKNQITDQFKTKVINDNNYISLEKMSDIEIESTLNRYLLETNKEKINNVDSNIVEYIKNNIKNQKYEKSKKIIEELNTVIEDKTKEIESLKKINKTKDNQEKIKVLEEEIKFINNNKKLEEGIITNKSIEKLKDNTMLKEKIVNIENKTRKKSKNKIIRNINNHYSYQENIKILNEISNDNVINDNTIFKEKTIKNKMQIISNSLYTNHDNIKDLILPYEIANYNDDFFNSKSLIDSELKKRSVDDVSEIDIDNLEKNEERKQKLQRERIKDVFKEYYDKKNEDFPVLNSIKFSGKLKEKQIKNSTDDMIDMVNSQVFDFGSLSSNVSSIFNIGKKVLKAPYFWKNKMEGLGNIVWSMAKGDDSILTTFNKIKDEVDSVNNEYNLLNTVKKTNPFSISKRQQNKIDKGKVAVTSFEKTISLLDNKNKEDILIRSSKKLGMTKIPYKEPFFFDLPAGREKRKNYRNMIGKITGGYIDLLNIGFKNQNETNIKKIDSKYSNAKEERKALELIFKIIGIDISNFTKNFDIEKELNKIDMGIIKINKEKYGISNDIDKEDVKVMIKKYSRTMDQEEKNEKDKKNKEIQSIKHTTIRNMDPMIRKLPHFIKLLTKKDWTEKDKILLKEYTSNNSLTSSLFELIKTNNILSSNSNLFIKTYKKTEMIDISNMLSTTERIGYKKIKENRFEKNLMRILKNEKEYSLDRTLANNFIAELPSLSSSLKSLSKNEQDIYYLDVMFTNYKRKSSDIYLKSNTTHNFFNKSNSLNLNYIELSYSNNNNNINKLKDTDFGKIRGVDELIEKSDYIKELTKYSYIEDNNKNPIDIMNSAQTKLSYISQDIEEAKTNKVDLSYFNVYGYEALIKDVINKNNKYLLKNNEINIKNINTELFKDVLEQKDVLMTLILELEVQLKNLKTIKNANNHYQGFFDRIKNSIEDLKKQEKEFIPNGYIEKIMTDIEKNNKDAFSEENLTVEKLTILLQNHGVSINERDVMNEYFKGEKLEKNKKIDRIKIKEKKEKNKKQKNNKIIEFKKIILKKDITYKEINNFCKNELEKLKIKAIKEEDIVSEYLFVFFNYKIQKNKLKEIILSGSKENFVNSIEKNQEKRNHKRSTKKIKDNIGNIQLNFIKNNENNVSIRNQRKLIRNLEKEEKKLLNTFVSFYNKYNVSNDIINLKEIKKEEIEKKIEKIKEFLKDSKNKDIEAKRTLLNNIDFYDTYFLKNKHFNQNKIDFEKKENPKEFELIKEKTNYSFIDLKIEKYIKKIIRILKDEKIINEENINKLNIFSPTFVFDLEEKGIDMSNISIYIKNIKELKKEQENILRTIYNIENGINVLKYFKNTKKEIKAKLVKRKTRKELYNEICKEVKEVIKKEKDIKIDNQNKNKFFVKNEEEINNLLKSKKRIQEFMKENYKNQDEDFYKSKEMNLIKYIIEKQELNKKNINEKINEIKNEEIKLKIIKRIFEIDKIKDIQTLNKCRKEMKNNLNSYLYNELMKEILEEERIKNILKIREETISKQNRRKGRKTKTNNQ